MAEMIGSTHETTRAQTLEVDGFGLTIGAVSVGLPTARTADAVLLRYIDLVRLARRGDLPTTRGTRGTDVEALAAATRLDSTIVRRRLERLWD